jgi:hypothetical protein
VPGAQPSLEDLLLQPGVAGIAVDEDGAGGARQPADAGPGRHLGFRHEIDPLRALSAKMSSQPAWFATSAPRLRIGRPRRTSRIPMIGNTARQTACVTKGVTGRRSPQIGRSTSRSASSSASPPKTTAAISGSRQAIIAQPSGTDGDRGRRAVGRDPGRVRRAAPFLCRSHDACPTWPMCP